MHTLSPAMILLLRPFAPLFSTRVWAHVQMLLIGALLAPAQRTVAAALRVVGLGQTPHFQRYHRVLSRASWSPLAVSRVLLRIDEKVERRTGAKIAAKGAYRDAVRSSRSHVVKATGLRWVSLMSRRSRSSPGLYGGDRWKRPMRKHGGISASRRKDTRFPLSHLPIPPFPIHPPTPGDMRGFDLQDGASRFRHA